MLKFEKYQSGASTLTNLGTVVENAGKGGKISFIRKNFEDLDKRVAVLITRANGESAIVACSSQVSSALRSKQMNIKQLANCEIVMNDDELKFISMPSTGALQEFSIDGLQGETTPVSATFLPQELIAF